MMMQSHGFDALGKRAADDSAMVSTKRCRYESPPLDMPMEGVQPTFQPLHHAPMPAAVSAFLAPAPTQLQTQVPRRCPPCFQHRFCREECMVQQPYEIAPRAASAVTAFASGAADVYMQM
jgi:hypothetical protein